MARLQVEVLLADHDGACRRIANAIDGLTVDEYVWRPVSDAYTLANLTPQPKSGLSTIEWKLAHVALAKMRYARLLLGESADPRTRDEVMACRTMEMMLTYVGRAQEAMRKAIDALTDQNLSEERPSGWPPPRERTLVLPTVLWRINHDVYHAGQIATIRGLFRAMRTGQPPN